MPSNQNRDNFIDKAFTVIAESIVKVMPIADKEKKLISTIEMDWLRKITEIIQKL